MSQGLDDPTIVNTRDVRMPPIGMKSNPDGLCLYVICATNNYIKVGAVPDVEKRLETLIAANPLPLGLISTIQPTIYGGIQMKRYLHCYLSRYHKHGDWFDVPGNILDTLLKLDEHNFHKLVRFLEEKARVPETL